MSDRTRTLKHEEFGEEPRNAARLHRVSLTCHYFEKGYPPAKIKETLEREHGIKVSRETPYADLLHAAKLGYLEYKRPQALKTQSRLQSEIDGLNPSQAPLSLSVIQTLSREDVGASAASTVRSLIEEVALNHKNVRVKLRELVGNHENKKFASEDGVIPVHIGVGGGRLTSIVMDRLGGILQLDLEEIDLALRDRIAEECEDQRLKPSPDFYRAFRVKLIFHNLVSGFDFEDPFNHPISYFHHMVVANSELDGERTEFRCFTASPLGDEDPDDVLPTESAAKEVKMLDIIIGSASSYKDENSALRRFYQPLHMDEDLCDHAHAHFMDRDCRGDLLWQPLSDEGAILPPKKKDKAKALKKALSYRPAALLSIKELSKCVSNGTKVVLAIGPVESADGEVVDQGAIFQAILRQKSPLLTHAIVDVETARNTLKWLTSGRA